MTKQEIRKEKINARRAICDRRRKDAEILKKLAESNFYQKAQTIMVYISYNGEVDTYGVIDKMLADNKTLCAPVCIDKETMIARGFSDVSELLPGAYGIPEPQGEEIKNIDLVIVPGVAFSEKMHRIGYGAGYYDRFSEKTKAMTCGLFYEMQKTDFEEEKTDKKLDYIVTEEKIYRQEN